MEWILTLSIRNVSLECESEREAATARRRGSGGFFTGDDRRFEMLPRCCNLELRAGLELADIEIRIRNVRIEWLCMWRLYVCFNRRQLWNSTLLHLNGDYCKICRVEFIYQKSWGFQNLNQIESSNNLQRVRVFLTKEVLCTCALQLAKWPNEHKKYSGRL